MSLAYQVREFRKGHEVTFEVWQARDVVGRGWFFRKIRAWEKIDTAASYERAAAIVSDRAGGYYKGVHDFNENGRPIVYGPW